VRVEGGRGNGHRLAPTVSKSRRNPVAEYLRHRRSCKLHAGDMQEFTTQTTKLRLTNAASASDDGNIQPSFSRCSSSGSRAMLRRTLFAQVRQFAKSSTRPPAVATAQ
jgi:hypothetical protein